MGTSSAYLFYYHVCTNHGGFSYVIPIATMVATYATYVRFYLFKETYLTQKCIADGNPEARFDRYV